MNNKANSTSFKKGHKPLKGAFGKGSIQSEQAKKLISKSLYGKRGKLARRYKGDMAGYVAIHTWVKNNKGVASECVNKNCMKLPSARFEWASLSGECIRDLEDFIGLCTRCHRKFDNGNLEIKVGKKTYKREKFLICENCSHKNIL